MLSRVTAGPPLKSNRIVSGKNSNDHDGGQERQRHHKHDSSCLAHSGYDPLLIAQERSTLGSVAVDFGGITLSRCVSMQPTYRIEIPTRADPQRDQYKKPGDAHLVTR